MFRLDSTVRHKGDQHNVSHPPSPLRRPHDSRAACERLGLIVFLLAGLLGTGCAMYSRLEEMGAITTVDGRTAVNFKALKQQSKVDCGAACLAAVLNHWNCRAPLEEIRRELGPLPENGYSLNQLKTCATNRGFQAFLISGSLEELRNQTSRGRPCIIVYERPSGLNHSIVVLAIKKVDEGDEKVLAMDPDVGKQVAVDPAWLMKRWRQAGMPLLLLARGTANGVEQQLKQ